MKPKSCKQCKDKFMPQRPLQMVCSGQCAYELSCIVSLKNHAKKVKTERQELRENLKGLGAYKTDLQCDINSIIRLIDKDCKCISCDKIKDKVDAGHYRAVGAHSSLRYHLFNIWCQCRDCNRFNHSVQSNYVDGIIKNFGTDMFHFIVDLKVQYPELKLNINEVKESIKIAREIIKELKQNNEALPRTIERRVELRKDFNNRLNIYK